MIHLTAEIPFIFIHVPRTGGTSIEAAFCNHFLGKSIHEITDDEAEKYRLPKPGLVHQHFSLKEYEAICPVARLEHIFKFAVVRNPWDLVISAIKFFRLHQRELFTQLTWKERIRNYLDQPRPIWGHTFGPQSDFVLSSRGDIVDLVIEYQDLANGFEQVCQILCIPKLKLGRALATESQVGYQSYYDDESADWVAGRFQADIALWGFEF